VDTEADLERAEAVLLKMLAAREKTG